MKRGFNWRPLALRTVIALIAAILIYGLGFALPRYLKHRPTPKQELSALKVGLHDDFLTFSALTSIDKADPNSTEELLYLRSHMAQTITGLQDKVNNHSAKISPVFYSDTQKILTAQNELLSAYDKRYALLAKAIQYNPSKDLGMPLNQNKDALVSRAHAASGALTVLGNNTDVRSSGELSAKLADSAGCFDDFAKQVNGGNTQQAEATLSLCQNTYEKFRLEAVKFVVAAFPPEETKNILEELKTVEANISKALKN